MGYSVIKEKFINYVNGIIDNDRVSHAYIIEVDNYDSDLFFVYSFIKMILSNESFETVNNSNDKIFNLIDEKNYPDIMVISTDSSMIKKNQMIDLQREYSNKSLYDNKRFYIINEAEKLNSSSANTILKFLEEPEDDIIAILLTDSRYHVIDTILSRCQVLSLKESNNNFNYDDEFLDLLDCVLNPKNFFINYKAMTNDYITDKVIAKEKFVNIEYVIIDYINSISFDSEFNNDIKYLFKNKSLDELIHIISIIEEYIPKLVFNVNYKLWLDSLFSKLIGG